MEREQVEETAKPKAFQKHTYKISREILVVLKKRKLSMSFSCICVCITVAHFSHQFYLVFEWTIADFKEHMVCFLE